MIYKRETIFLQYTLRENHIFADFNDLRSDNTVHTGKMDNGENVTGPTVPADSDEDVFRNFDDSDRDKTWDPDQRDNDEINENEGSILPAIRQKMWF